MKKFALLFVIIAALGMTSCGNRNAKKAAAAATQTEQTTKAACSGNCEGHEGHDHAAAHEGCCSEGEKKTDGCCSDKDQTTAKAETGSCCAGH